MPPIDPQIPKPIVKQVLEDHGQNPSMWPEELQDLMNPSVAARTLSPPISGQIQKRMNRECEYYWAYDRCGQNPNHERVEQLRYMGFEYATTRDVQMYVEDTVKGRDKDGFSDEIRSGDRRLMKCPKQLWREFRKSQNLRAISQTYPQGRGDDGTPMSLGNLTPGMRTYVSDEPVESIRARATVSDAAQELASGNIKGNASVAKVQR